MCACLAVDNYTGDVSEVYRLVATASLDTVFIHRRYNVAKPRVDCIPGDSPILRLFYIYFKYLLI